MDIQLKGHHYVVDHFRYSYDLVVVGIYQRLHHRRFHSHPARDRYCRGADTDYSGPKTIVAV